MKDSVFDPSQIASDLPAALATCTRLLGKPISTDALFAGIPINQGGVSLEIAARAAERAGFHCTIYEGAVGTLESQDFPCLISLNNGQFIVATSADQQSIHHIRPGAQSSEVIALSDISSACSGRFLRLTPMADSGEADNQTPHWFWTVIKHSRHLYGEVILASFLTNLFALATPLFIMNVYDRVVPNQALNTLWVLASGVTLVMLFDLLMKSLRGYFLDIAGKRADILLSSATFEQVLNMRMQEHPARVGSFASQLQEFDQFREFFTSTTLMTLIDLPFILLFIGLIFIIAGPLGFIPLLMLPLVLSISYLAQRKLAPVIGDIFSESARKTAMLIETLNSLEAIKAIRAESTMQSRWEQHQSNLAQLGLKARLWSLTTLNLVQTVQQGATVILVIAGVYAISRGDLTVGGLIACTILTGRSLAPMAQIATIMTRYQHARAAYSSIDTIMQLPGERDFKHQFLERRQLDTNVEFKNVSFTYPGQSLPALKNIHFRIASGERVAIIGPTGSGKSTLQRLIAKLYLPTEGNLLIGNTDIHQIDPADLRKRMSYLPQEPTLLAGSVRENIRLGFPTATDEALLEAAAFGGIRSYFDQHPQGFDFQVGERGAFLSGGQRQGIALARAMLNQAELLLLDEPSNAMDQQMEQQLIDRLSRYANNRTLVLVTHRINLLQLVDRVIILNDGRIAADGTKNEILNQLSNASKANS
ncbi:MAG: type I secretion system permease/ATPase [Pseudomonadales bacterium]